MIINISCCLISEHVRCVVFNSEHNNTSLLSGMIQSLIQRAKSTLVYSVSTISYCLFDLTELVIKTLCVIYVREAVVKFWGQRSHTRVGRRGEFVAMSL